MNHEKTEATGASRSDREQMRLLAKNLCPGEKSLIQTELPRNSKVRP